MGDQVHVDRPGFDGGGGSHPGCEQLGDPAAAADPQDELGGVDAAGEVQQRGRDVGADDLVVGATEAFDEDALAGQVLGAGPAGQAVVAGHVDCLQVGAFGSGGDPGGAADDGVALTSAG